MTLPKFVNDLLKTVKNFCNPLQVYILIGTVLFLFEIYEINLRPNYTTLAVQVLTMAITGGLIYKLCKDGDTNMAYLVLGIFLSFWFIQKSNVLDQLSNTNSNKVLVEPNKNVKKNENVKKSENLNLRGDRGNSYMVDNEKPSMDMNMSMDINMNVERFNPVPVATNNMNTNVSANFNGNKPRAGLNGNIPVKGNETNSKSKVSNSESAENGVNAYNSVGAYARVGNVGNLADYYEKRAKWVNQVDLSMPDGIPKAPHSSEDPCVIQQDANGSIFDAPSTKLRNYGINSETHEPLYQLQFEDSNKVQVAFDPYSSPYVGLDV